MAPEAEFLDFIHVRILMFYRLLNTRMVFPEDQRKHRAIFHKSLCLYRSDRKTLTRIFKFFLAKPPCHIILSQFINRSFFDFEVYGWFRIIHFPFDYLDNGLIVEGIVNSL